ncbi:fibrobacter succinogenes major paralogous domain-containing protein [Fibrobacter sp. UWEL]|uniref:fibrobacter succinogenes major paralogous domain-containing protein n=1 Tax=Fibrobacter sp. UWEL TaxID=1896209 RepID=UPI0009165CAA|nr:fibrobacter succinogenes major paralogous domain-containing protein [Fibrobacter sp. UWEL]SHK70100.1 major paralogous domain-containing protein [Fibrobacter sp. UWEL]
MGIFKKIGMAAAVSILFVACGDDNSTKATDNEPTGPISNADYEADDFEDLPHCTSKKEGATGFVVESGEGYVCKGGDWVRDDEAVDIVKSSSSQKGGASSSSRGSSVQQNIGYGELKDSRDGRIYKTVKIGKQTWMAENLNYKIDISYYCYEDDAANSDKYGCLYKWNYASVYCYADYAFNCDMYGRLYEWNAALVACPEGWHLPSMVEFETLIDAVGGSDVAGTKLKSVGDWNENGNGTDAYGFSALPAGWRFEGDSRWMGSRAYFWSSTESSSGGAYILKISGDGADFYDFYKAHALSVRCLQD